MNNAQRNVFLISFSFFFIFFGFGTAQQYLVILFAEQGRGNLALTSLFILYGAFLATGIVAAKIIPLFGGLKKSLLIGGLTYAIFTASVAINSAMLLYIASILIGIGAGLLWVSSGQIIRDSSNERTVGRNFAYQTVGMYGGNILGINIGSYLVQVFSVERVYLVLTASILLGLIFILWVRPVKGEIKPSPFKPYYMFNKKMLMLLPLVFGAYFLQAQVFTAVNFIIVSLLGVSSIALMITIIKISNIVGGFSSGKISGWYDKSNLLILLILMALLGVTLLIGTRTLIPVIFSAILLGFSMAAIYPVCLAWLNETIPAENYIYALGVFHVYSNLGMLSAILANLKFNSGVSFVPGIAALALAFPGIVMFRKATKKLI